MSVAELQKANVRCTKIGIQELEESYFEKTYSHVLGPECSYNLWKPIIWADNPNTLSGMDLTTSGTPLWRSSYAHDCWISHKAYKLKEALYKNSTIFKNMIDYDEKDFDNFYLRPCCMASTHFWWWLEKMIRHGLVEGEDVDALPEVMFREIAVGSGLARKVKVEEAEG
ncbi:hypothetical protein TWF696_003776 [Orbilia brochopaga]|uniref:Uncharacterized protein n=1 Tax=Orbilia brochopaga TaxID=3140254 RepID=A0AAV9V4A1_9PEZI